MQGYHQLSFQERSKIFEGIKAHKSIRAIAKEIDRWPSTISREIKRNSDRIGYFYPSSAQWVTENRKAKHGSKISRNSELENYVCEKLNEGWAPDAIAGRWSKEQPNLTITKEAIYSYIYSDVGKAKNLSKLLPRAKKKRGVVRKKKVMGGIPERVSINERPDTINQRIETGHFEVDLMFHEGSMSQNVTTISERITKFAMFIKNDSKHSEEIIKRIASRIGGIAKSATFDNGLEFARHTHLRDNCGIKTYFCRPGAPYEKGGVEHLNGMSRRWIPFKESPQSITKERLHWLEQKLNHIPRRSLKYLTPCEAFSKSFQNVNSPCCTS